MVNNTLKLVNIKYQFVLNIMVNDITCNDIVHSVSVMTLTISAESLLRQNWVVLNSVTYLLHNIY